MYVSIVHLVNWDSFRKHFWKETVISVFLINLDGDNCVIENMLLSLTGLQPGKVLKELNARTVRTFTEFLQKISYQAKYQEIPKIRNTLGCCIASDDNFISLANNDQQ